MNEDELNEQLQKIIESYYEAPYLDRADMHSMIEEIKDTLLSPPTCSAFESYWDARGVTINPPIMREAMKEVAWKSWQACASHAVLIADSWQHETPSILRMKLLPNSGNDYPPR